MLEPKRMASGEKDYVTFAAGLFMVVSLSLVSLTFFGLGLWPGLKDTPAIANDRGALYSLATLTAFLAYSIYLFLAHPDPMRSLRIPVLLYIVMPLNACLVLWFTFFA